MRKSCTIFNKSARIFQQQFQYQQRLKRFYSSKVVASADEAVADVQSGSTVYIYNFNLLLIIC